MKFLLIITLLFSKIYLFSQEYCIPNRFSSVPLFNESQLTINKDILYGQEVGWNGDTVKLFLDLYYPSPNYESLSKRPLIVFIHGGGFLSGDRENFAKEAFELSKRGFVCASIDYRLGWESNGTASLCEGKGSYLIEANYRACQDIRASLRYLVYFAESFGIDPDYIYLAGASAGSISGLTSIFFDSYDLDDMFPDAFLIDSLGLLDNSTNQIDAAYNISGMISLWGGIPDTSKIQIDNSVPLLLMHGLRDEIVPIEEGYMYDCPEYFYLFGSGTIAHHLEDINECYELNYRINGEHGAYDPAYTIERMHKFLKQLLCNDCSQNSTVNPNITFSKEESSKNLFKVFPNPTLETINIVGQIDNTNLVFELTNIYGYKVVLKKEISFSSTTNINIEDLSGGMYVLNIYENNNKIFQFKIIKL